MITLVPTWKNVVIRDRKLYLQNREIDCELISSKYQTNLKNFILLWIRRYQTLLNDSRVSIVFDLTGGRDSRVLFAFFVHIYNKLKKINAKIKFNSLTTSMWQRDLKIATNLLEQYQLVALLNKRILGSQFQTKMTETFKFELYALLNIGIYYPIYIPWRMYDDPLSILMHGGAGECHRNFYPYQTFDDFVTSLKIKPNRLLNKWLDRINATLISLKKIYPSISPWIGHYREFRNRLHLGRTPQYQHVFSPFSGILPATLSEFPNIASTAQLHYDCMESLAPGLMFFEYDDSAKEPTSENIKNLTLVDSTGKTKQGSVFITDSNSGNYTDNSSKVAFDYLIEMYEKARTSEVLKFMPEIVEEADKNLQEAPVCQCKTAPVDFKITCK